MKNHSNKKSVCFIFFSVAWVMGCTKHSQLANHQESTTQNFLDHSASAQIETEAQTAHLAHQPIVPVKPFFQRFLTAIKAKNWSQLADFCEFPFRKNKGRKNKGR